MAMTIETTVRPRADVSPTSAQSASRRPSTAQPASIWLNAGNEPAAMAENVVRVAALADLHCTKTSQGAFQPLLTRIGESADLLLLAGDLTDYGLPEEARVVLKELSSLRIPIVAVLGNHDYESGKEEEIRHILADGGVVVLDGDACEISGIGI